MDKLHSLAAAAVVVLVASCVDAGREPTSPSATTPKAVPLGTVSAVTAGTPKLEADASEDPRAKFQRKNFAGWVGKAHDKALDDFFVSMMAQTGTPQNVCARILDFMSEPSRIPTDKQRGTRAQHRRFAAKALSGTRMCQGQVADTHFPEISFVSTAREPSEDDLSPAANYLLDQTRSAVSTATTAYDLATSLTSVLNQADLLAATERDIIYSTASVAQSSYDYWGANLQILGDQTVTSHGPCLGQYGDQAYALNACLGIAGQPIVPTAHEPLVSASPFFYAALQQQPPCSSHFDRGEAARMDFEGAVVGGLLGWAFPGPGIFAGAVGGGAAASMGTGAYQTAAYAWCRMRGGGGLRENQPRPM